MSNRNIDMVITDFDGTLLQSDRTVSSTDVETLEKLGRQGICRVIATGRSYFSLRKVISHSFPCDYVIVSSGAGVILWPENTLVREHHMEEEHVEDLIGRLISLEVDFCVQHPLPDNHFFAYHDAGNHNPDFLSRIELYKEYAKPFDGRNEPFGRASQIIGIIPGDEMLYARVLQALDDAHVIRSTSPLDGKSIWIELFPRGVSKSAASAWLAERLSIEQERTLGIGNDYNDMDLLQWTGLSAVVANSIDHLKGLHPVVPSNDDNGFTHAVLQKALLTV